MSEETTLYERLGGRDAIAAVVDEFYDRVVTDERVNGYFEDMDMTEQRAHQTQFLSAVAGGPADYDGRDMREAHADLGIDDRDFEIIAAHLDEALADCGVREADREAVMAEVESLRPEIVAA
ncbi:group I truncated hemoglobin [Halegenticoccus soli]|uniref:group I truncated hemoglobin n=1 Tax=Halegenticoccus soli TaxID=1985678 RepID=UPI000C6D73C7|nr:group 1 truncated hemoglobin [Halegenticoccus soli]